MKRCLFAAAGVLLGLVVLAPFAVVAVPLWCVAAAVRLAGRLLEPRFVSDSTLFEFDPEAGWRWRQRLDTHHKAIQVCRITTDGEGWTGDATIEESTLLVFGDSFASGYGVNANDAYANLSAAARIKPIAVAGYSMVEELLWMKRLAPRLRDKHVVWLVYLGNDLYENLVPHLRAYRKPFVRRGLTGAWEIVTCHVRDTPWPIVTPDAMDGRNLFPALAALCASTFLAQRAYGACEFLIAEGQRVCAAAGAELTVVTVPDSNQLTPAGRAQLRALGGNLPSFDADLPDTRVEAICGQLGVPFIAGRTFLDADCYQSNDCHWNEEGHRRVAAALAAIRTTGSRPSSAFADGVGRVLVHQT